MNAHGSGGSTTRQDRWRRRAPLIGVVVALVVGVFFAVVSWENDDPLAVRVPTTAQPGHRTSGPVNGGPGGLPIGGESGRLSSAIAGSPSAPSTGAAPTISGVPGPDNTGWQHTGVKLQPVACTDGQYLISTDDTVVDGKLIPCSVRVNANHVTISRSKVDNARSEE